MINFCRSKYRSNDLSFAIATLARYRAKKLTGQRLRSAGIKVSTVRYCDLRMQSDRYLAEHRDESWPGRRRLKRKSRHSNNRRRPANQELRLCKCREQNDDHRLCPREHTCGANPSVSACSMRHPPLDGASPAQQIRSGRLWCQVLNEVLRSPQST